MMSGRGYEGKIDTSGWSGTVAGAMLALSGCYIFSPSQAQENKAQTALHFDISQCQQTAPNLYKCPGVDKSICGAFYAGQQVDCVGAGQRRQRDRHEAIERWISLRVGFSGNKKYVSPGGNLGLDVRAR